MPSSRASEEQQHDQAAEPERDLQAELERMEDRFKRALADLDNYRKRSARELERLVAERGDAALLEWLEVVDGVERALRQKPANPLYDGLRAVLDQMDAILARQDVRRIGERGEPFDPNRHEAVMHEPAADGDEGTLVTDVMRPGYSWKGRVLRAAMVKVRG